MDNNVFLHKVSNACEQYATDFIAKRRNAGASVSDLMRYYDPDVRHSVINYQDFAEEYLDEQTRDEWEKRCEQEQDEKYGIQFIVQSGITVHLFDMLEIIAKEHFDGESLSIVTNDPHLWAHLDIKKKEKGNSFNLGYEVAEYIYHSSVVESLEELDHYRGCIWGAISEWCKGHGDLIREKYTQRAKDNS